MKSMDLIRAMDGVNDALLQDAIAPVQKKKSLPRAAKMGLIAACLCVALVGTVLAVELLIGDVRIDYMENTIPPMSESTALLDGFAPVLQIKDLEEETSEEKIPEGAKQMPEINTSGVAYMPEDFFSDELVAKASEVQGYEYFNEGFSSWSEMEQYLGLEILNNAVLDAAEPWHTVTGNGDEHCQLQWLANSGELRAAHANATYLTNYQPIYEDDIYVGDTPVYVYLNARAYTEHSPIAREQMFGAYYFPDGTIFTEEPYETANGKVHNIVGVSIPTSPIAEYYAFLPMNGAAVCVHTSCVYEESALDTMKQILDSFE